MKNQNWNLKKGVALVAILLFWGGYNAHFGQQGGSPLPRVSGEADQEVNAYTGRLNVKIPLTKIVGRGETGTSLDLINSGAGDWSIIESSRYYNPQPYALAFINYAATPSPLPNFREYSPMSLSFQVGVGVNGALAWDPSRPITSYLVLKTNGGDKVIFRDVLRDGEPTEINTSPANGPIVQCSVVYGIHWIPTDPPPPPPPNPPSYCSRGRVFRSVDGSGMTFVSDNDVYDAYNSDPNDPWGTVGYFAHIDGSNGQDLNLKGYIYLSNGTKYRISGGKATMMVDRNGNVTSFNYVAPPYAGQLVTCDNNSGTLAGCWLNKVTDSLNREISIDYGMMSETQEFHDTFTYNGFGGVIRQVKIVYDHMTNVMYPGLTAQGSLVMQVNVQTGVVTYGHSGSGPYNPLVISRIELPNAKAYQFKYNSFGEIARVKTPTGSYTDYIYGPLPDPRVCNTLIDTKRTETNGLTWVKYPWLSYEVPDGIVRRVTESRLYEEDGNLVNRTTYSDIGSQRPVMVSTKDVNNQTLRASKHYYMEGPCKDFWEFTFRYFDDWRENREYKTELYADENASSPIRIVETTWEQRAPIPWTASHPFANATNASSDPRVTEVKTTLETGQITKKTFSYDQDNNITDINEYDYGNGQVGPFLRKSHTDYVTDPNYTSLTGAHLKRLPLQTWISSDLNGSNKSALIQFEYDNYNVNSLVGRSNVSGHDTANYGVGHIRRGNVTKSTLYADAQNQTGPVSNQTQYDILGNVVKSIDARGFISTIDYSDRFGFPDADARSNYSPAQLSGQNTFAFATSTINPAGFITHTQFDYFSGLVIDDEDWNENVSTTFYNDVLDRPTQRISANNRPTVRAQTTMVYDDLNRKVTVTSDRFIFNDNLNKGESLYDSLGRTTETRSYEIGGFTVTSKPEFDALSRIIKTSNPYRPYLNEQPVWTTTTYDTLGRVVRVKTPDDAEATTAFYGNITTALDQAGKKRRSVTNAIGQVTRVDEPNNANDLGDIVAPTQPTYYTYNVNGNLVKVAQGQQNRYFLYDALGRLTRVRQPEQGTNSALAMADPITGNNQWSAGSTYDPNGNVLSTTDAKGVTISQTYDSLNRSLNRTYSDGTPTVSYEYENQNIANSKGKLTKETSSVSTTEATSFGILGKVTGYRQTTDGQAYATLYAYNLSGAMVEETYPSGRVVKSTLDNDGKLTDVSSKPTSQADFHTYANSFTYMASGAVSSVRMGNGRWESAQFNSRLQIIQIGLGTSLGATNLWKVNYDYGEIDANGNLDANKNNGNVARQTINFTGLAQPFVQSYLYDSLSRLIEAKEMSGSTQTFKQNFGYDRYGNRTSFSQLIGTQQTTQVPSVDPATNRFTTGQGFTYDFNGNLIMDNQGRQFVFNGDNKQKEVRDVNNNLVGTYFYDGSGKRVKKVSGSETTIFVYDAEGKLVAEYSTATPTTNPTISYLTNDSLGSPRVITDNSGTVTSRRDFMPFGEELCAGTTNRVESAKYSVIGNDNVRKRFTGYEKDAETGLDFAEARYYDNRYGRFTAIDPLLASGKSTDPQTFNRYIYVTNNPIVLTDPTGEFIEAWTYGGYLWGVGLESLSSHFMTMPEYFMVTRTTQYKATAQDVNRQADITITIVEILIVDRNGNTVVPDSNPSVGTSAVSVGSNPIQSQELRSIENIITTAVRLALKSNWNKETDIPILLGILNTETRFGLLPNGEGAAHKVSTINPGQFSRQPSGERAVSEADGYTTQQALEINLLKVMGHWNGKDIQRGKTLNDQLQRYNGEATKAAYAVKAERNINSIKTSRSEDSVTYGRFSQWGRPTAAPLVWQQCTGFPACPKFR